jgi:hypothetical protein
MEASSYPSASSLQIGSNFSSLQNYLVPTQLRYMDPVKSNETGYSGNMLNFPASTKEKVVAQILATKFHTVPVTDSRLEIRLNPIMRDLVINRPAAKKK